MIRVGRIDLTMLGGIEVRETGDIANKKIPRKIVKEWEVENKTTAMREKGGY